MFKKLSLYLFVVSCLGYAGVANAGEKMSVQEMCVHKYKNDAFCGCLYEKVYMPQFERAKDMLLSKNKMNIEMEQKRLQQILSDPAMNEGVLTRVCAPSRALNEFNEAHPIDASVSNEVRQENQRLRHEQAQKAMAEAQAIELELRLQSKFHTQMVGHTCDPRDEIARLEQEAKDIKSGNPGDSFAPRWPMLFSGGQRECGEYLK